jgi:hypothetical protein
MLRLQSRFVAFIIAASFLAIGCQSKSSDEAILEKSQSAPSKPPMELVVGVWDTRLKVDKPKYAKMRAADNKITLEEANRKADDFEKFLDSKNMRMQITWQINADGTAIIRRKIASFPDDGKRRHLTWKLLEQNGHSATLELTDKSGEKKVRKIKITFRNNDTFHLDADPEMKAGLWIIPVQDPDFTRNTTGTDLKKINVQPAPVVKKRTVPISDRWKNIDAALADAPDTKLETREVRIGDLYLIDIPKDATIGSSSALEIKLASGAAARFGYGHYDTKRGSTFTYGTKEFSFLGRDLIIEENKKNTEKRYEATMNISDGFYDFEVSLADDPNQVVSVDLGSYATDSGVAQLVNFPNLESVKLSMTYLGRTTDSLRPLTKCKKLKRFVCLKHSGRGLNELEIETLAECQSLRELDIHPDLGPGLTPDWFKHLGKLTKLTSLKLQMVDEKKLSGLIHLSACKEISEFGIEIWYGIKELKSESVFNLLKMFPKLTRLSIQGNLSEKTLQQLKELQTLEALEIQHPKLDDADLSQIANLSKLKELSIIGSQFTSDKKKINISSMGVDEFSKLEYLEVLKLKGLLLDDDAIKSLQKLKNVRELSIDHTPITFKGLMSLKELPNLKVLHLRNPKTLDKALIDEFRKAAPQIQVDYEKYYKF